MSAKYRVDVVNQTVVPCGMNSIVYISNSWKCAKIAYDKREPGKDSWGKDNCTYGVILSIWDGSRYVIKCRKGI